MTVKHWFALGAVSNQYCLKARSSLSKKEKAENKVQWTTGGDITKRKPPKGCFPAA